MRLKFLFFALLTIIVSGAYAQRGELKLNLQYSYALPLSSFKTDVINNNSPRGVTGDFLYGISNQFSLGLGVGFQDFYQKYPRSLYQTGKNETTSAVLSNSVQVVPVLAKAQFTPLAGKSFIHPYVSLAAGTAITTFTQYLGEFGGTYNSASFMLQAGAGFRIPFNKFSSAGIIAGADYNYISYNKNDFSNLNNLNMHAGVYFPLR